MSVHIGRIGGVGGGWFVCRRAGFWVSEVVVTDFLPFHHDNFPYFVVHSNSYLCREPSTPSTQSMEYHRHRLCLNHYHIAILQHSHSLPPTLVSPPTAFVLRHPFRASHAYDPRARSDAVCTTRFCGTSGRSVRTVSGPNDPANAAATNRHARNRTDNADTRDASRQDDRSENERPASVRRRTFRIRRIRRVAVDVDLGLHHSNVMFACAGEFVAMI